MTVTLTLEHLREFLPLAVETQGREFIYNPGGMGSCEYLPLERALESEPQSKTGCLIGVLLDLAGETRHHGHMGSVVGLDSDYPDMFADDRARNYAHRAQVIQDAGGTWGMALDEAEAHLGNGLEWSSLRSETKKKMAALATA